MFAVQQGGACFSGPDAATTYQEYGRSMNCEEDGEGGPWANQVFNITGRFITRFITGRFIERVYIKVT